MVPVVKERIDPAASSYLRFLAIRGADLVFHETERGILGVAPFDGGGLQAILGPKIGHTITAADGAELAKATARTPFVFALGPREAVRAFVDAHSDGWERISATQEMLFREAPAPRPARGHARAPSGEGALPAPFDAWMVAFTDELFKGPMRPPPVTAMELWSWYDGDVPVCMAGALPRGDDAIRIVCVYTPPELRGRGYAGALVTALAKAVEERGIRWVTLDFQIEGPNARSAYERAGFRPTVITERWQRVPSD